MKMHLKARPPSDGARKLARWLGRECGGDLIRARFATRIDETQLQRLLDGETVPGEELVRQIAERASRSITRRDWRTPATLGWFDSDEEPGRLGQRQAA